jgi:hypothetical protein
MVELELSIWKVLGLIPSTKNRKKKEKKKDQMKVITIYSMLNICHLLVMRAFKTPSGYFEIHTTLLLTLVTSLCNGIPELILPLRLTFFLTHVRETSVKVWCMGVMYGFVPTNLYIESPSPNLIAFGGRALGIGD